MQPIHQLRGGVAYFQHRRHFLSAILSASPVSVSVSKKSPGMNFLYLSWDRYHETRSAFCWWVTRIGATFWTEVSNKQIHKTIGPRLTATAVWSPKCTIVGKRIESRRYSMCVHWLTLKVSRGRVSVTLNSFADDGGARVSRAITK
jgi:hypothetical protein